MDWLLGSGYRDLWAEPIEAEVLDLGSTAGGLTPVMTVGGLQTFGLALAGEDGRSYTFRLVDKGSPLVLPEGFRGSGVELFTQDPSWNRVGRSNERTHVTFDLDLDWLIR